MSFSELVHRFVCYLSSRNHDGRSKAANCKRSRSACHGGGWLHSPSCESNIGMRKGGSSRHVRRTVSGRPFSFSPWLLEKVRCSGTRDRESEHLKVSVDESSSSGLFFQASATRLSRSCWMSRTRPWTGIVEDEAAGDSDGRRPRQH